MKKYEMKANCRGCRGELNIQFKAPLFFDPLTIAAKCHACGSSLAVHVKRGQLFKQVSTRVQMIKHTQKILDLLKEREAHA